MASIDHTTQALYSAFLAPSNAFRGQLDPGELLRQIRVFQEMGFGGFFMHSRTGLVTEYLGEAWFEAVNVCADEAARLGMEAWIYDEDRWPSGTAGGLVTMDSRFRRKFFGPLHLAPPWPAAYGPPHRVPEPTQFSPSPQFIAAGLLAMPEIVSYQAADLADDPVSRGTHGDPAGEVKAHDR